MERLSRYIKYLIMRIFCK